MCVRGAPRASFIQGICGPRAGLCGVYRIDGEIQRVVVCFVTTLSENTRLSVDIGVTTSTLHTYLTKYLKSYWHWSSTPVLACILETFFARSQ